MSATAAKPARREVRCPTCGGRAWYDAANPWRPFCSERCRQADLGAWATESYRIDGADPQGADDRAPPAGDTAAH